MNYSLTDKDIRKYLGKKCKIIKYEKLSSIDNLETYMNDIKFLVILYEWKPNYGHWCCIIKNNLANTFEFFDSYGTKPDQSLFDLPIRVRNNFGLDMPKVAILLMESKRTIIYNNYMLQSTKSKITTCGKWVVIRCLMIYLPIDTFAKIFIDKKNTDKYLQLLWVNLSKYFKKY